MAYDYEKLKSAWDKMDTNQRKQAVEQNKNNADFQRFAQEYNNNQSWGTVNVQEVARNANLNTVQSTPQTVNTTKTVETPTTPTRQETPTTPVTPTKTETITPTTEIKQEWALKPLSQDYYNQTSQDSQEKIVANLNNYKTTNPEYFTDYEAFKRNFSYDARNEQQKNTLDTWYKWYSKGLELSWTPVTDLYTQYQSWSLSTTDLESLRVSNPSKYAELQAQINKGNIIAAYDDDKGTSETMWEQLRNTFMQNMITNLNTAWSWASNIFADYQEKMESPEMVGLWDQATEKQEEIEKITADIDSMRKQVEAEYEWTWASRAKINAIVADRTYDLQLQLRSLNSEYNRIATQYNNRMNQYQSEFQLQLQEYQINMQERNQKMNELGFAMDLMNYETPQQKQEREWNYWVKQQEYQNWDINSKDYSTRYKAALKWVQNLLAQYPNIPMERSAEQMAEDVLKAIDGGSTLWTELSNINKLIQKKPEYKKLYNNTYGTGSSVIEDSFKSWNTEWVKYNGEWMTTDEFNKKFWSNGKAKAYTQVDEKVFNPTSSKYATSAYNTLGSFLDKDKYQDGKYFWECGKFVNDYLQYIGVTDGSNRYYDNDLSTKLNSVNTYDPKVWSIAVFDYNHKSSDGINHGHVGIVTKVYEDWSFDVIDSNYDSNWKIQKRHVNAWQASTKWFFDPSQTPKITTSSKWLDSLSPNERAEAEWYIKQLTMWTMNNADITKYTSWMAERWLWDLWNQAMDQWRDIALGKEQRVDRDKYIADFQKSEAVKDFEWAKNQFNQLVVALNDTSWVWDMSAIFTFMKTLDPSSVVRESEFNSAAETAWVLNPSAIWQKLERSVDWKFLTSQQREDFQNIAKEFIKVKVNAYNDEYEYIKKMFEISWIPSDYLPQNNAQLLMDKLSWSNSTITDSSLWFDESVSNLKSKYWMNK